MGTRGPVPKKADNRVRRNQTDENGVTTKYGEASTNVKPPAEDKAWHPVIKGWYRSLKDSGQTAFYEPSDWQAARLVAHYANDVLRGPQRTTTDDKGNTVPDPQPIRPTAMRAIWQMMGDLLTTETARRRARIELIRASKLDPATTEGSEAGAEVTDIADYRSAYE